MNPLMAVVILAFIVLVLVLLLIILMLFIHRSPPVKPVESSKALEDMALIMRTEYEEKEREKHERELVENARRAMNKNQKPVPMKSSVELGDRPVRVSSKQNELIPYNLSSQEK